VTNALRGPRVGWGKLERSASVSVAADKASAAAAAAADATRGE